MDIINMIVQYINIALLVYKIPFFNQKIMYSYKIKIANSEYRLRLHNKGLIS